MAGEQTAAKRYAQAAFQIAKEGDSFDRWLEGVDAIAALMTDERVDALMTRSKAAFADKVAVVEQALPQSGPLVVNLAKLLVQKHRTYLAPFIARSFREMVDLHRGVSHARVRTAVPLSDEEQAELARRLAELTGGQVRVELTVDPSIIGGLVARIGDRIIDGSTEGKLRALRRRLQEATG